MRELLKFFIGISLIISSFFISSLQSLLICAGLLLIILVGLIPKEFSSIVGNHARVGCILSRFGIFLVIIYILARYKIIFAVPYNTLLIGILLTLLGLAIGNIRPFSIISAFAGFFNGLSMGVLFLIALLMPLQPIENIKLFPLLFVLLFFSLVLGFIFSAVSLMEFSISPRIRLRKVYVTMTSTTINLNDITQLVIAQDSIIYSAEYNSLLIIGILGKSFLRINTKRIQLEKELPNNIVMFLSDKLREKLKNAIAGAVIPADVYYPGTRVIEGYELINKTLSLLKGNVVYTLLPFFELYEAPYIKYMCIGPFSLIQTPLRKIIRVAPFLPITVITNRVDGKIIIDDGTLTLTKSKLIFRMKNSLVSLSPQETRIQIPYYAPRILLYTSPLHSWVKINKIRIRVIPNYAEYLGPDLKLKIHGNTIDYNGRVIYSLKVAQELLSILRELVFEIEKTIAPEIIERL